MHRTQIQLTEKQIQAVRNIAVSKGVSMAEIIRMSVEELIGRQEEKERKQKERALSVVGKFSSGLNDLAQNHDKYLVEDFEK
jgi:hypothetical protein